MGSRADAAAYVAYRMPATAAATALALRELSRSLPGWSPRSLLDLGAGTGGAAWAVAEELPTVESMTLLEQSADAIRLGEAILAASAAPGLRAATWCSWRLPVADGRLAADSPLPQPVDADLATASYVLGELTSAQQSTLVTLAMQSAPAVLLVEPGTPAGHRRILAARAQLLAASYLVAAPCPHQAGCPLDVPADWCHFSARLQRSAMHRQAKGAELSYEDEKFSYVGAVRPDAAHLAAPAGRIVRRPQQRKGLVTLSVCAQDGSIERDLVSKSKGELYRQARKISWGDPWPVPDQGRST